MNRAEFKRHMKASTHTPRGAAVPSASTPRAKQALREQIQRQTEAFEAAGGKIRRPDLQDRTKKVMPRFGASFTDSQAI